LGTGGVAIHFRRIFTRVSIMEIERPLVGF
jgi:hypothetical protein